MLAPPSTPSLLKEARSRTPPPLFPQYLHNKDTLHRDLKTENLLLDARNNVKITDFGVARIQGAPSEMTGMCGSIGWMAPEVSGTTHENKRGLVADQNH